MAINKETDLRFVLGYTPLEFRDTLHMLAEGTLDATPLLTGQVGLEGVGAGPIWGAEGVIVIRKSPEGVTRSPISHPFTV